MTIGSMVALFGAMVVLAFIPGVSAITVSARSAASGFNHGVFTTIGIVVGDIIFILLAIFGLSVLAETMDNLFVLVKYLGGAYLIWLGIALWRSRLNTAEADKTITASLMSSFLAGLFITLGDQKAILFYLVFFPAFLDLSRMSYFDVSIIIIIAAVAIVCAKLSYAYMAVRASLLLKNSSAMKKINIAAGSVMIGTGIFLVTMTQ